MTAHDNSNANTKIVRLKDLLDIEDGGVMEISDGALMNVEDGGEIAVKAGGVVNFEADAELQIEGVAITATAADINNGVGSSVAENVNTANEGTVVTGVTQAVHGDGVHNRFTLTLDDFAIGDSGDNASLGVGAKFFSLPAGVWMINAAHVNVGVTIADGAATAQTPVIGIGTVVASGAVAVLSGTATFQDVVTGAALADLAGTAKLITQVPTANKSLAIPAASSHDLFLNLAVAWADITAASALTASGTIVIEATKLA